MTETSLLPGMTAADQTAVPPPGDIEEVDPNRRRLLALGGVAGVIVVGAAAFFLLHHSSSPSTTTLAGIPNHVTTSSGTGSGQRSSSSTSPTKLPKSARRVSEGRDPFTPLVVAPVTNNTNTGGTTTVTGNTQPSSQSTGSATTPTTGAAPTTPTSPSNGGSIARLGTPQWIQLETTHGDKTALFKVGYPHHKFHVFSVSAPKSGSQHGTVFDGEFALIGIQDNEVTVQVGDATPFDLPTGVTRQL